PPVEVSRAQAHHQKVMAAIEAAASNSPSATPWWSQMQQRLAVLRSSARRMELPRLALLRLEMPPLPRLQATGGLIAVVLIILAIWFTSLRTFATDPAHAATLTDVAGTVEVAKTQDAPWSALRASNQVLAGQRVQTGANSFATLQFFEGSELYLAPNTEVTIVKLQGADKTLHVEIEQNRGKTAHDVVPLQGNDAAYVVNTPGGEATVQGTTFSVDVSEDGQSRFAVDEGQVTVSAAGEAVVLQTGETTIAAGNAPPAQPTKAPRPSLSFEPDELVAAACEAAFSFDGTLVNTGSEDKDVAAAVELGYAIVSGAEYIQNVALAPSGWDTIEAGEVVNFSVAVALADGWEELPSDTEVKVRVFIGN